MRRLFPVLFILVTLGCTITLAAPTPPPLATLSGAETPIPTSGASTPQPAATPASEYILRTHPDGALYTGDWVSFEIISPPDHAQNDTVEVIFDPPGDAVAVTFGPARFQPYGITGREQATLIWAWDTQNLPPGDYPLTLSLEPEGVVWTETVTLLPAELLSPLEREAAWASVASECCAIHYVTGSAAERDLPTLLAAADEQAALAVERMGVQFTEPITITLLPRVLGHGGFASDTTHISYLDRNYMSIELASVLHHEFIHILDGRLGGDYRPTIFVEGLAVYLTGGHYKPEPLAQRAAALLDMPDGTNWYIPLKELADDFYPAQHEIGYLEAGALVGYMVERWGWVAFDMFYRNIASSPAEYPSTSIEIALRTNFGLTFDELEQEFLTYLRGQTVPPVVAEDLYQTVRLFDAARRYQQALDPSAYFGTAWLLDTREMRRRAIIADYLRRPDSDENLAIETMLAAAGEAWRAGDYVAAWPLVRAVEAALTAIERGEAHPFSTSALAQEYLTLVKLLRVGGYEPQRIVIGADGSVRAWATTDSAELSELELETSPAP